MADALESFRPGSVARIRVTDEAGVTQACRVLVEDAVPRGMVLRVLSPRFPVAALTVGAPVTLLRHNRLHALASSVRLREIRAGEPTILVTDVPLAVERGTHRDLFRVDVDLPANGEGWGGRIVNLSGSGCLLVIEDGERPVPGDPIRMSVRLPSLPAPIDLWGEVVRSPGVGAIRSVGIQFVGLTRRQADDLVRYVTRRQSELLRRGAIPD